MSPLRAHAVPKNCGGSSLEALRIIGCSVKGLGSRVWLFLSVLLHLHHERHPLSADAMPHPSPSGLGFGVQTAGNVWFWTHSIHTHLYSGVCSMEVGVQKYTLAVGEFGG